MTENGQPVSGLTVRVKVDGPEDGVGEILCTTTPSPPVPTVATVAGDQYPDAASQKLALLLAQRPELFAKLRSAWCSRSPDRRSSRAVNVAPFP